MFKGHVDPKQIDEYRRRRRLYWESVYVKDELYRAGCKAEADGMWAVIEALKIRKDSLRVNHV